jgi:hypothetical protein
VTKCRISTQQIISPVRVQKNGISMQVLLLHFGGGGGGGEVTPIFGDKLTRIDVAGSRFKRTISGSNATSANLHNLLSN